MLALAARVWALACVPSYTCYGWNMQQAAEDSVANASQGQASLPAWVYSFNVGVEAEAAGRTVTKNWITLRRDLAALPWLLAGPNDIVLAPPQRPAFLAALRSAGARGLPQFLLSVPQEQPIAGHRPYGIAGPHLRRSRVTRYRSDVDVCTSLEEVTFGPGRPCSTTARRLASLLAYPAPSARCVWQSRASGRARPC